MEVVADWTLLLVALLLGTSLRARFALSHPRSAVAMAVVATVGLFMSIFLHELSHALVGKARHLPITRIRLYIFGGATEGADTSRPSDEFIVTAVGPGANFVLAGLLRLAAEGRGGAAREVLLYLAFINLALGLFNLVPGFPLDGGRMLRAAIWRATSDRDKATLVSARVGQGLGGALIITGIYHELGYDVGPLNPWSSLFSAFIGWFIFSAARASVKEIELRRDISTMVASQLMWDRPVAVHPDESLARVSWMFDGAAHPAFPVVDAEGLVVGLLTVSGAHAAAGPDLSTSGLRVADVMQPPGRLVVPGTRGLEVVSAMAENGGARVVVVDPWGRLVGMVTAEGLTGALRR